MGAKKQTNGGVGRRQGRQAAPADSGTARSAGNQPGKPPTGTYTAGSASAARVQPRGCKGRSPLHKITLKLPLPRRGRGRGEGGGGKGAGGWGKGIKLKAGQAGGNEGKPPPADTTAARSGGDQPGKPPKNHSSASSSRKAVTKPRAAASSDASAKIRRRGSVPENRQITKELSAK